ncbi:aminopeptidase P family protein [Hoyosella rhizosphaerae]|uniref:Xaa-Pro aminopeptidase n=1 Tax=Hoyosella rhizosphaerae TaxID=1755582 RepID=A0A916U1E4_9ACTN|nr:Xaa-Pro peptidase family protein [Hoyosella rhizosphaerae]MBN4926703.1 aminopeptidase P family protein [Hoyosella rhizosphaerae]GGC57089.1 Xaa-Pro aminopeptidase [Hoyosella rhizosphaerae]
MSANPDANPDAAKSPRLESLAGCTPPGWLSDPDRVAAVASAEPPAFSAAEYARRLTNVRSAMLNNGLDGLVVSRPSAVEYICGYFSAETIPQPVLITQDELVLFVPDFEVGRAVASSLAPEVRFFRYATAHTAYAAVAEFVAHKIKAGRVGADSRTPVEIVDVLRDADSVVVPGSDLVDAVRIVMSEDEIRCVEIAGESTERGVQAGLAAAAEPGATDATVAAAISAGLVEQATSRSAWQVVVATGNRAGIPHSTWRGLPLAEGATFIEFAGTHNRYHAPIMRTFCRGKASPLVQTLSELSRTAVEGVLSTAKAGMPCDEVARTVTKQLGPLPEGVVFHELFGYPVGLAHPPHWMDSVPFNITIDNPEPLREGMVFHMPGSFRSIGKAGVGLSQTFVIEKNGTRVLTKGDAEMVYL